LSCSNGSFLMRWDFNNIKALQHFEICIVI
jgi:hypothetical protein